MRKAINIALILLLICSAVTPIFSSGDVSRQITDYQLRQTIGGQPAEDCALLLSTCLAAGGASSWFGWLICGTIGGICLLAD